MDKTIIWLLAINLIGVPAVLVSNAYIRIAEHALISRQIVTDGFDAADDWIADHIEANDVCVTNDIPLAGRCLEKGALAIKHNGELFTTDSIGMALATRTLMQGLRETGQITGGPAPFSKRDRAQFLDRMETTVQKALRG